MPAAYLTPLSAQDRDIHGKSVEELVRDVHTNVFQPIDILRAYGKVAVKAHGRTNCLTEIMIAEAEGWAKTEVNLQGMPSDCLTAIYVAATAIGEYSSRHPETC